MNRRSILKAGALGVALSCTIGATAAFAQNVTLRMSTWLPPRHHLVADTLPTWIKTIEEASGGTLTIKIDPAPIAKPPAQYDVVRDGAADMAYHVAAYTPGPFEILRGLELPFLSPNGEIGSQAAYDWYDRNIGFDKEFKDVKVVTLMVHGAGAIHSKKSITKLEDLEGVKLRVGGGGVRMSEALGATPVAMPAPQAYEAIQKGVADGAMFPFEGVRGFKIGELTDHHLKIPGGLYTTVFAVMMNRAKWDALSDEHKKVLTEQGGIAGAKILGAGWDRADEAGLEVATADGGMVHELSPEEVARWKEKVAFMNEDWIKRADDAGLDGKALLADLIATVEKYSK
ncbi:TRAP transporter substrate-binding protein [Pseudahrensia aquimaris]|uniref:TRAP transporter substrate-binding protein n=1 Tax=Pseudahrensia aquimaris TaxID=744461 RepID=A0ABW3FGX2_9HYPH